MIISKTPLRMSFVGGGSDMYSFYKDEPGTVLSVAINKYIYINVNKKFDAGIRIAYSQIEEVMSIKEIKHKIFKAALEHLNIKGGLEVTTIADVPSRGTGLGSSSAFTVGLINALGAYQGRSYRDIELANLACKVEIEMCNEPIGKQDQFASAFGGMNLIQFNPDGTVRVIPLALSKELMNKFEENLIFFYTGISRSASEVLTLQNKAIEENSETKLALREMAKLAYEMSSHLQCGDLSSVGKLLHENWLYKRSLSKGITSDLIDNMYEAGMKAGALGGKLLGAGAGGFLIFYAEKDLHKNIEAALPLLKKVDFKFEMSGSKIIFKEG